MNHIQVLNKSKIPLEYINLVRVSSSHGVRFSRNSFALLRIAGGIYLLRHLPRSHVLIDA